jgi:UrcA family protein
MKYSIVVVALAAVFASGVGTAKADSGEPRSVTVRFADLDTTKVEGAATLYQRLKSASAGVCRGLEQAKGLTQELAFTNCVRTAMSNAVVKVNRPAVTAYAAAHGMPASTAIVRIASNK